MRKAEKLTPVSTQCLRAFIIESLHSLLGIYSFFAFLRFDNARYKQKACQCKHDGSYQESVVHGAERRMESDAAHFREELAVSAAVNIDLVAHHICCLVASDLAAVYVLDLIYAAVVGDVHMVVLRAVVNAVNAYGYFIARDMLVAYCDPQYDCREQEYSEQYA